MAQINIGIVGAAGRMGQAVAGVIARTEGCRLVGGTGRAESAAIGAELVPNSNVHISSDLPALAAASDILIEFAGAEGALAAAAASEHAGIALLVGSTGLDQDAEAEISATARSIPLLRARNTSAGVALLSRLVEETAAALGPDYDIEIVEHHHREKRDAPSGTALQFGEAAARGRGSQLDALRTAPRHGAGEPRPEGSIGFVSIRGGSNPGEHQILFSGAHEQITLAHRAMSNRLFAEGAVEAALWLVGQPPGLYGIDDVLGL